MEHIVFISKIMSIFMFILLITKIDCYPTKNQDHLYTYDDNLVFNELSDESNLYEWPSFTCLGCKAGVALLHHLVKEGQSDKQLVHIIYKLCKNLRIETQRVCEGITNIMGDEFIYVFKNLKMTSSEICGIVIGDECGSLFSPAQDWNVTFPLIPKPPVRPLPPPVHGKPTMEVLHLSDYHYDPYYAPRSNAECGEPMCCRENSGKPNSEDSAAGWWGSYGKCDIPKHTIDNMLQHIATNHKDIDYILWTGDLPPHDVWNQTREGNINILIETVDQIKYYFPTTPVFPALGNHESAPVNYFPPPFIKGNASIDYLYEELDKELEWSAWLPNNTSSTIKKGGFYSVPVKPGFRIISVNTNYCNNKNWWLMLNTTDPALELQWLIDELQLAESDNETVHIIGHIPPGPEDCLIGWSRNYYNIVNRYESTVTSQFFGHTHWDEFELHYDQFDHKRVTSIAYIAPSVTTYEDLSPSYRIYSVEEDYEGSRRMALDHETWIMNLEDANLPGGIPNWFKLYSAKDAYNMTSLLPDEWNTIVDRMVEDKQMFEMFYKFYWHNSPRRPNCNSKCKKQMIKNLKSIRF